MMHMTDIVRWLLALSLCAAAGVYAASTVDVYKDPG
jgi:hypothetical protein